MKVESQKLTGKDGNEVFSGLQVLQLIIILNARQFQTVNFFILAQQGIVRWTEQGIPPQAAQVGTTNTTFLLTPNYVVVQAESFTAYRQRQ